MELDTPMQQSFSIVSAALTVEALRDSGYRDTDHALAELVDNSIEAEATIVDIVAVEEQVELEGRRNRKRMNMIAVADNGIGMNPELLRRSLRFGDGTRLGSNARGIGKFGVGLPQASISQCKRIDVWSWTNGPDNAMRCYLCIDEIRDEGRDEIAPPVHDPVPDEWRSVAQAIDSSSGTLVVWSNLDRVNWSGGDTTLNHTERLCGRIYRNFITDENSPLALNLIHAKRVDDAIILNGEPRICQPNDPLYLTAPSSTPEPFADIPMFKLFNEHTFEITLGDGESGKVTARCSMTRKDAVNEEEAEVAWPNYKGEPGGSPWGKHANNNLGVSIVRSRRELEMNTAWVNNYDPTERWWSVEVAFDPILDKIFGVDNNKQHAHYFTKGAAYHWKDYANEGETTLGDVVESLKNIDDPSGYLIEIWNWIDDQIKEMRRHYDEMKRGARSARHTGRDSDATALATEVIEEQKARGDEGGTDKEPALSPDEKIQIIEQSMLSKRIDSDMAHKWAEETVTLGRRVIFKEVLLDHDHAFFQVEFTNDVIEVWINTRHLVHKHLIDVLNIDPEPGSDKYLRERLERASFTLRMLLIAWARYEDKATSEIRETLRDTRIDWGREARDFFRALES